MAHQDSFGSFSRAFARGGTARLHFECLVHSMRRITCGYPRHHCSQGLLSRTCHPLTFPQVPLLASHCDSVDDRLARSGQAPLPLEMSPGIGQSRASVGLRNGWVHFWLERGWQGTFECKIAPTRDNGRHCHKNAALQQVAYTKKAPLATMTSIILPTQQT